MAKYYGTGGKRVGSVGNETYTSRKGVNVVKAKATEVTNPKTRKQCKQRAKFGTAVLFYKRMVANLFRFAYEDKKANETDFNAYMRHNTNAAIEGTKFMYSQQNQFEPYDFAPALGKWMVSQGSLLGIEYGFLANNGTCAILSVSPSEGDTTIGQFSAKLIAAGFTAGDIVTIATYVSNTNDLSPDDISGAPGFLYSGAGVAAGWTIKQFKIDADSTALLSTVGIEILSDRYTINEASDELRAAFIIVSRPTDSGLLVSTNYIAYNTCGQTMLDEADTDAFKTAVENQWGATEAILQGSLV